MTVTGGQDVVPVQAAIGKLVGQLDAAEEADRRAACDALAALGNPRAIEALVKTAAARGPEIQALALDALRRALPDGGEALTHTTKRASGSASRRGDWLSLAVAGLIILVGVAAFMALVIFGEPSREDTPPPAVTIQVPSSDSPAFPEPPDPTLPDRGRPGGRGNQGGR